MAGVLRPLLGKHLVVTITPQDVSSLGVFSDNAFGSTTLSARLREVGQGFGVELFQMLPMDAPKPTLAVLGENPSTYELVEWAQALPTITSSNKGFGYAQVFARLAAVSWYHKLVIVTNQESGAAIKTETVWVVLSGGEQGRARSDNADRFQFMSLDVFNESTGARIANPSIALA